MGIEPPEWLPEGWKVTVKARSTGKKDRYFIDPSNGRKFNSKSKVLWYLKSCGRDRRAKDPSPKPKDKCKISIRKTVAENLPPGWIKEIRTRRNNGKTRSDPSYIDPNSGRHFRSMQEVFRYLDSQDPRKTKAKAKQDNTKYRSQSLPAEAKGQRLIDKKADGNVNGHKGVKLGSSGLKAATMKSVNMPEGTHLEQSGEDHPLANLLSDKPELMNRVKQRAYRLREGKKLADDGSDKAVDKDQSLKSAEENTDTPEAINAAKQKEKDTDSAPTDPVNKPPLVKAKEQCYHRRRHSKRLADIKLKDDVTKGSEDASEKNVNVTGASKQIEDENNSSGVQPNENPAVQNERKYLKRKWVSDLPRRSSNRLARVEVDPSMKVKTSSEDEADDSRKSGEAEVCHGRNIGKVGLVDEPEFNAEDKFGRSNDLKDPPPKCRHENPAIEARGEQKIVGSDCKENSSNEKHLESTLQDLLMDPCIEFAVKTLTGVIPIEDPSKASSISPMSSLNLTPASSSKPPSTVGIWADPCFEFAVKTLTSDMPVQDSSQLQITFQQPFSPSTHDRYNNAAAAVSAAKLRSDNLYSLNHSSTQFDAVKRSLV